MTNQETREAIAKALGWLPHETGSLFGMLWREPNLPSHLESRVLPDWTRSLSACARDLLPVARERGWVWTHFGGRAEPDKWCFYRNTETSIFAAPTGEIALALCEAWLAGPGKAVQE